MLLKKQTVWLLTMLSLVVVLSVYYITSPEQQKSDLAAVEQKAKDQADQKQAKSEKSATDDKTVISSVAGDAEFEELRMKLDDMRSEQKEELTLEMASNLPADEKSKIKDQMDQLTETAHKEQVLETMIKTMGYDDALVRAEGEQVKVTVKSKKKPSATEANKIILEVKKELNDATFVSVAYQPSK
ncbi:SpoIIIAH-like family protein [Neobacillus mesonae]|uniref:SpoIIIAH-like family protein n=1 Tax=Neobacillus mesonae TaxID=1193713 RepID=UPI00203C9FA2|nr:SpoIIIAH-like family protein [Neobacillus mesonae]MCM3566659.1 SpoIIIAH-like family protein [Neobacillus mesonae]